MLRSFIVIDPHLVNLIRENPRYTKMLPEEVLGKFVSGRLMIKEARYVDDALNGPINEPQPLALKATRSKEALPNKVTQIEATGLNDEQMAALKKDDVDGVVGAFTKDAQGYAAKIASLVLRNITRFVSNNYYIENMKKIDHLDYRCMAAQKSEGAHDFCIGFAMKDINETFIKVAEGYTGEQFNMTGVEVSDAVGEFVNCISGLFATAMAKDGMELEILPQVAYDNQVAKGEAYVMPIFIDGEELDLYVAIDSNAQPGSMPIIGKMRVNQTQSDIKDAKGTVVIVDDSGMSRKMLRNILEGAGFAVVGEASDGIEGVLAYKQFSPDVITLDITMPNMDGTEALKQIKDYDEDAKAVMITAAGQQNKVIEALKIGAEKFITKPFDKEEVVKAVTELAAE